MSEADDAKYFRELITVYCREDADAIQLCEDYLYVAHIWDDLYDKDKEVGINEMNKAFCKAIAGITRNPIYQGAVKEYAALSLLTALTWQIANRFESGNKDELMGSFILRNSILLIIYFTVLGSGARMNDDDWGIDVGEQFFRDLFKGYHDKYLHFLDEMRAKNESSD